MGIKKVFGKAKKASKKLVGQAKQKVKEHGRKLVKKAAATSAQVALQAATTGS